MKNELSWRREAQNDTFDFCRKSMFFDFWNNEIGLSCRRDAHFRDVHNLRKLVIILCWFYENSIFSWFFDDGCPLDRNNCIFWAPQCSSTAPLPASSQPPPSLLPASSQPRPGLFPVSPGPLPFDKARWRDLRQQLVTILLINMHYSCTNTHKHAPLFSHLGS